jgi:hypothetical protein
MPLNSTADAADLLRDGKLMRADTVARVVAAVSFACPVTSLGDAHYVSLASAAPGAPYTNWVTAATNIQDAVDAASAGDTVLVTNGTYYLTSEIAVTNAITIQSVNGPGVTLVDGQGTNRCFNLTNSACTLSGFTITNGYVDNGGLGGGSGSFGGGVYCHDSTPAITNCVLSGNSAFRGGGSANGTLNHCILSGNTAFSGGGSAWGALNHCTLSGNAAFAGGGSYQGTLNHCVLSSNSAYNGGGSANGTLNHCTLTGNSAYCGGAGFYNTLIDCTLSGNSATNGGGGYYSTLNHCALSSNSATAGGGGHYSTLNYCALSGNSATDFGGGSYYGMLSHCTLSGNSASEGGGSYEGALSHCTLSGNSGYWGGGSFRGALTNCIVFFNTAPTYASNVYSSTLTCSCTAPDPGGTGNVIGNPRFVNVSATNFRLLATSPCIDAGTSLPGVVDDLDGTPRPLDGDANGSAVADMGAYEYVNAAADSDGDGLSDGAELNTHGTSPIDTNTDGDRYSDGEEVLIADTDPNDPTSYFHVLGIERDGSGVFDLTLPCSTARTYFVEWGTNLLDWATVPGLSSVPGDPSGFLSVSVTNDSGRAFFRGGVRKP